jgi:hypothetical protein
VLIPYGLFRLSSVMSQFNFILQSFLLVVPGTFVHVPWPQSLRNSESNIQSNPSRCTMALGSTQPLTEMSTRNLPGDKERPERGADNFTVICEHIA